MARRFTSKKRGKELRKRKPTYLMVAEGRNKTETNYFSHFQSPKRNYVLRIIKAGSNTDIESLYDTVVKKWEELGLATEEGDCAFIVFDLDNDEAKINKAEAVLKDNNIPGINFIASNPSFEIWLLLHFKNTSKYYMDGNDVISDLKKYIVDYEKNKDVFVVCESRMEEAIKNAFKLKENFEKDSCSLWHCNPMTDVMEMVKCLINR